MNIPVNGWVGCGVGVFSPLFCIDARRYAEGGFLREIPEITPKSRVDAINAPYIFRVDSGRRPAGSAGSLTGSRV
jgi:hypothetical protein